MTARPRWLRESRDVDNEPGSYLVVYRTLIGTTMKEGDIEILSDPRSSREAMKATRGEICRRLGALPDAPIVILNVIPLAYPFQPTGWTP